MKTTKLLLLSVLLALSSCIYTDIKMPLDSDVTDTQLGTKQGSASSHSILWLVAWGDSGTQAAAKNGGITTIKHLDQRFVGILWGLYTRRETFAYGD